MNNQRFPKNRNYSILQVLAAAGWILFASIPRGHAQEESRKSIHALELEAHRDIIVHPAPSPRAAAPLAPGTPSNASRTIFGYYPYWRADYSQIRFRDLTHLAVFSVEADGAGNLVNLHGWPNEPLINAAHQANVKVVLVCTLFNSSSLQGLLSSPDAYNRLIANLRDQLLLGNADGVNIDFEGVPATQKNSLVAFMRELASVVRSAVPGAHISMATPAVDWSQAWDYPALADICDALMIMAYDYHWAGSPNAGPVSPLSASNLWGKYGVQWTIADYLTKVSNARSNRLLLGVPYYGYDWPTESDALNARKLADAKSKIYTVARNEASQYGRRWDTSSSTPWYFYNATTPHQTWYEDEGSLSLKYDLVLQNGLQGIGIWALTYDNATSELWQLIEERFSIPAPPEAPELSAPSVFFGTSELPVALKYRGTTPMVEFQVAVGTSPGATDLAGFTPVGLRRQALIRGLSLSSGKSYYVTARSVGRDGATSLPSLPVKITIDSSLPVNRKYVPRWVSNADYYTGLAMVNSSASTQAAVFRAKAAGQPGTLMASWVLQPGEQLAQIVSQPDLLGAAALGHEGWLEIECTNDAVRGMYLIGDTQVEHSLAGSPLMEARTRHIVPFLDRGSAQIMIANPEDATTVLDLRLKGTPEIVASRQLSLGAGEFTVLRISDLFAGPGIWESPSTGLPFITSPAYLEVQSNRAVAITSWLRHDGDAAAVPALDPAKCIREGAFSYFVAGGGWASQIVLLNPTSEHQTVECRSPDAGSGFQILLQIAPLSSDSIDLGKLLAYPAAASPQTGVTGIVLIKVTSGSGVTGGLWSRSEDYGLMAALPLDPITSGSYVFPQLAQSQGYWTGMNLANPLSTPSEVVLEARDASGGLLGNKSFSLAPGASIVGLIYQWIPATLGVSSGRIEVRSNGRVLATEIFGSDKSSFMAAVPGQ